MRKNNRGKALRKATENEQVEFILYQLKAIAIQRLVEVNILEEKDWVLTKEDEMKFEYFWDMFSDCARKGIENAVALRMEMKRAAEPGLRERFWHWEKTRKIARRLIVKLKELVEAEE